MGGIGSAHERDEKFIKNLIENPEGKRPCGKPRSRWERLILKRVLKYCVTMRVGFVYLK
jgi:hypothetical protein